MKFDRVALDLPHYEGLLAGHHRKEPGYTLRRAHGTDDWLIVATLSGAGRFGFSLGDIKAEPGSLHLLAPGTAHDYGTHRGADVWEILWVHFHPKPDWVDLLKWPTITQGIDSFEPKTRESWDQITNLLREVYRLSITPGTRRMQFAMNGMERFLLECESMVPNGRGTIDGRILEAIEHIHIHLGRPLALENLSNRVHLSSSRFSHLFRSETGMAPLQYIHTQRMNRAAMLLERTTLGVSEIAYEVGMEPFHFSARFKEHSGDNPRKYRSHRTAMKIEVD